MKKILSLLAVLTITLFITGCTSVEEVGVEDDKIYVANCAATSGPLAFVGLPFVAGIEAYFEMVNENGGIDGRMIEYLHTDDEFQPEKGIACVEKYLEDEPVFAFVGHFGTPIVGATRDMILDAEVPIVYYATGLGVNYNENAEGVERYSYPVQPMYTTEGRVLAARAIGTGSEGFGAKKVGVIYTTDDAGQDLLGGVETELNGVAGVEIVKQSIAVGATSATAQVAALEEAGVDAVIIAAIQGTAPLLIKELSDAGVDVPYLTTYVNASIDISQGLHDGGYDDVDLYASAWVDITLNGEYGIDTYQQWSDDEYDLNAFAQTGWIAAHFFVEGVRRVAENGDDLTRENFMDAMEQAPISNPFGGELDFSNGSRLGTDSMALIKYDPSTLEGGIGWVPSFDFASISDILG